MKQGKAMIGRVKLLVLALVTMLAASTTAHAQFDVLPEIRGGVFARGVTDGAGGLFDGGRIEDANAELLFAVPALDLALLGEFRPHLGGTLNTGGRESLLYGGLSYTFHVPVLPVFVEASLGAALQNGSLLEAGTPQRFGCAALLRASGSIGVDVLPGASVMLTAEHLTDGGMCDVANDGLTNVGVRVGFRF